jgi:DNA polymerase-3 subunit alpha
MATADSHYPSKIDAADQRILLCSLLDTTLKQVKEKSDNGEETGLGGFFKSNNYHIPSLEEMMAIHNDEEIDNTVLIAEMCQDYKITNNPVLPNFKCPGDMDPDTYLRELCVKGWKELVTTNIPKSQQKEYSDRIKMELSVFKEAGLASYFLIVQDYCNYARSRGMLLSPGRGSGAGCMVSALIGITDKIVDPIKYGLLFERFYNAGRNAPGRISLPDIDCDFPIKQREEIVEYIRNKHGHDRVCQMVTFSRMQGRGAVKDVLRAHEACSFDEINLITNNIPDEAEIADELQLMREETGEASIVRWALENNPDGLKQWCHIKEDGTLDGPYAKLFEQAIRLEGTKRSQGKHAAGVVISASPLAEVCPMVYDKSTGFSIAGMEMADLESMGHVKFDILGVAVLDKIMGVQELVSTGKIQGE